MSCKRGIDVSEHNFKEENKMLNITLSNGTVIQWNADQYTDYMYDGKCFIVIKGSQWVGVYNMDFVRSVEVDK